MAAEKTTMGWKGELEAHPKDIIPRVPFICLHLSCPFTKGGETSWNRCSVSTTKNRKMVCKIFAPHNTRVLYDYSDPRRGYWRTGYNNVNAGNTTTILAHLRICFLLAKLWYSYIIFCKDETPQSNIWQCKETWWRGNPFTRRKRCCGSAETGIWKCSRCRKQIGFFSKFQ